MFNWNGQQPRFGFPQQQMIPGLMPQGQFHVQQPMSWVPPQQNPPTPAAYGMGMVMGQPQSWPAAGHSMLSMAHAGPVRLPGMPGLHQGMVVNTSQPSLPPMPDRPPLPEGPPLPAGPPPPLPNAPEDTRPPLPQSPQAPPPDESISKPADPDPEVLADLEKLRKEEEMFMGQYKVWKKQYDEWRQQNESHPNKEQFEQYLEQWKTYEKQMEARRKSIENQRQILEEKLQASSPSQPTVTGPSSSPVVASHIDTNPQICTKDGNPNQGGKGEDEMGEEDMNLDDEDESACGGIIIEESDQKSSNFDWEPKQPGANDTGALNDQSSGVSSNKLDDSKKLDQLNDEQSESQTDIDKTFPGSGQCSKEIGGDFSQGSNTTNNEWSGYGMNETEEIGIVGAREGNDLHHGRDGLGSSGRFGNDGIADDSESNADGYGDQWSRAGGDGYVDEGTNEREGYGFDRGFIGGRGGARGGFEGRGGGYGGGRGGFDGGRGGFDGVRGEFESGTGGFDQGWGGRGGFEGGRGGRGGFEGGRGGFQGGRGGFEGGHEGGRGAFEGGRGGFKRGRGGFERGRGGFEGGRGGLESGRGGFEGGRGGFEGGRGGFEGGRGGFEGGRGGFEGGRGGFEGSRGGFEGGRGGRGGFEGGRGGRGGFEGGRGGRGGFEGGRGGFEGGRGGFEGGRGGFEGGRGGFEGGRGGFEGGRGGFEGGRGGFEGGRGGFEGGRGGFEGGRGGFEGGRGGFEGGRGGFEGGRGGYGGERGGFSRGRGGFESGYDSGRGFHGGRGGGYGGIFDEGRGGFKRGRGGRGGFEARRGGFNVGRGGLEGGENEYDDGNDRFESGDGGYGDEGAGFDGGRGGFRGGRGNFDGGRGAFGRGRGGRGRGLRGGRGGGLNSGGFGYEGADYQESSEWDGGYSENEGNYYGTDANIEQANTDEINHDDGTRFGRGGRFQRGRGRGQYQGSGESSYGLEEENSDYSRVSGFSGGFRGRGRGRGMSQWSEKGDEGSFTEADAGLSSNNDNASNYSKRGRGANSSNVMGRGGFGGPSHDLSNEDYPGDSFESGRGGYQERGGIRGRGGARGRSVGRGASVGNNYETEGDEETYEEEASRLSAGIDSSYYEGENEPENLLSRSSGFPQDQSFTRESPRGRGGAMGNRGRGRGLRSADDNLSHDNEPPRKLGRFELDDPLLRLPLGLDPYRRYPLDPYLRDPYLDPLDPFLPLPLRPYGYDPYDYDRGYSDYLPRLDPLPERRPIAPVESIDYGHGNTDKDKKATVAPAEVIDYGHGRSSKEDAKDSKEDHIASNDFGDKDFRQEMMSASRTRTLVSQDTRYTESDKESADSWQRKRLQQLQDADDYNRAWRSREEEAGTTSRHSDDGSRYGHSQWESGYVKDKTDYSSNEKLEDRKADLYKRDDSGSSRFDDRYRERRGDREEEREERDNRVDRDRSERDRGERERDDRERDERERRSDRDFNSGGYDANERSIRERDRYDDRDWDRHERVDRRHMEDERSNEFRGEMKREKRAFGIGDEWLRDGRDRDTNSDRGQFKKTSESGSSYSGGGGSHSISKDYSQRDRDYSQQSGDRSYSKGERGDNSSRYGREEDLFRRQDWGGDPSRRTRSDWREDDVYPKAVREHHNVVPSPDRHMTPPVRGLPRVSTTLQTAEIMKVEDLLCSPQRLKRPPQLVVIIRGLPGSGKTYVSKLLREKEASYGGQAPRILCLDDYFMVEVEKKEKDPETGKTVKKRVMEYEYEQDVEEAYRQSMLKSFKKTVDDGFFPFIIVDATNEKTANFSEFWSYAKSKGFQVYVAEMVADVSLCIQRNIHCWTEWDIEKVKRNWEQLPSHYIRLDIRWLLQEDAIQEVEMEDTANEDGNKEGENDDEDEEFAEGVVTRSKWEFDTSDKTLDKLDGIPISKKHIIEHQSMDDYLQLDQDETDDDYFSRESVPGKKRVRWADLEEKKTQSRRRDLGFIVGQTQRDWDRITDDDFADKALNQTKYFYK